MSTPTTTISNPSSQISAAVTDVEELLTDLDGGQFAHMLSVAVSECAAATVDLQKKSLVNIQLSIEPIKGTHQVHIEHKLVFARPTIEGKRTIEATRGTPMHVGKGGRLSLAPENQMSFLDRAGKPNA